MWNICISLHKWNESTELNLIYYMIYIWFIWLLYWLYLIIIWFIFMIYYICYLAYLWGWSDVHPRRMLPLLKWWLSPSLSPGPCSQSQYHHHQHLKQVSQQLEHITIIQQFRHKTYNLGGLQNIWNSYMQWCFLFWHVSKYFETGSKINYCLEL